MRVARLADEMDVVVMLQQHISVGGKKRAGKLDRSRQLTHQQERAGGLRFDSETSTPNRLCIGVIACGATSASGSVIGPAVAIERYSPSGPQRQAISHSRLRLRIKVGFA